MKVLLIDDGGLFGKVLRDILITKDLEVVNITQKKDAMKILDEKPDEIGVVILDGGISLNDHIGLINHVKNSDRTEYIPIIFIDSYNEVVNIEEFLNIGVYDYLKKPFDNGIFYLKVKNAIKYYENFKKLKDAKNKIEKMNLNLRENYRRADELNRRLEEKNKILGFLVDARTEELERMTTSLISALENANLYNDENTGKHIIRVSLYAELISEKAGFDKLFSKKIKMYAPLHDIGKVGISDNILKKPGRYTEEEFEEMKKHVTIGYNMIKDSPLPKLAKEIILYHHEKWDGTGYTNGLKGEEIPLAARIVAIADVFDALTTKRTYKEAFSLMKALKILEDGRGKHFDPFLLDIFFDNIDSVLEIREENKDE
ncbi:HD-GYP domain-containing protein [Haliovirga abyssi]|uniref:Two-component system response regulator n=1 Tax=Haliovirga abyssi TaxID=2996794 RepID=A0AAU9DUQ3_9FUSO|nr:HD domain-containing phosphohydrolase [Haliovirga abyssi]BDU49741.1 two-component system response regulator [Haliovirga abyssi]